jgi:hypothetical protein
VAVVDDLVANVDGGAVPLQGQFHDFDGAIDAGTEAARCRQQNSEGRSWGPAGGLAGGPISWVWVSHEDDGAFAVGSGSACLAPDALCSTVGIAGQWSTERRHGVMGRGITVRKRPGKCSDRGFVTQTVRRAMVSIARPIAFGALLAALSGCGMSSLTSGIGSGWFGSSKSADAGSVDQDQLLAAAKTETGSLPGFGGEVAYGCPRFQVWAREGFVTIYEPGKVGDGLAVMHRGEITKTARECDIEPGRVTVKYGFSGRVLLGQKGRTGRVTLPVTVFVTDSKRQKVATDTTRVTVDMALDNPISYFSVVRSVSFAIPEGSRPGEYEVYVSFDRNVPGAG